MVANSAAALLKVKLLSIGYTIKELWGQYTYYKTYKWPGSLMCCAVQAKRIIVLVPLDDKARRHELACTVVHYETVQETNPI